jgi:hypothetical protein
MPDRDSALCLTVQCPGLDSSWTRQCTAVAKGGMALHRGQVPSCKVATRCRAACERSAPYPVHPTASTPDAEHWHLAQVRCAGAIWLVSLLTYTQRHPALLPRLEAAQEAFSTLLGDSNELTQVSGSLKIAMYLYDKRSTNA